MTAILIGIFVAGIAVGVPAGIVLLLAPSEEERKPKGKPLRYRLRRLDKD